jgi:hypothetical protein
MYISAGMVFVITNPKNKNIIDYRFGAYKDSFHASIDTPYHAITV